LIERADIDEALSMNAYFASFMLLLFNAVGLAVPASAATAERMVPELGSVANLSEAAVADSCSIVESALVATSDHRSCAVALGLISTPIAVTKAGDRQPAWAVVVMRSEIGDKLEHEEGAP
tara:strand:+ start:1046 stop:1408 length:363 start_codon:yes stop_codon:yes gene_type:complete